MSSPPRTLRARALLLAGLGAMRLAATDACANPHELQIELAGGSEADRNPGLRADEKGIEAGARWGATLALRDDEDALLTDELKLAASGLRYHGASDLNEDRRSVDYMHVWQRERTSTRLTAELLDRDALTSVAAFGGGEAVRDDDQRRREGALSFDHDWQFDDYLKLGFSLNAQRTRFHGGKVRSQADFDVRAAEVHLHYELDEYSAATVALSADRFESELAPNSRVEKTLGVRVSYVRELSESTRMQLAIGVRDTRAQAQFRFGPFVFAARSRQHGLLGQFDIEHEWSGGIVSLGLKRSRLPSGVGAQFDQDEAMLNFRVPLNGERVLSLLATFDRNRADVSARLIPDERLWGVRASLNWELSDSLQASMDVGYREQTIRSATQQFASGASVQLALRYQLDPVTL